MISTDNTDFINTYNSGKTQLFWTWIGGDLETPVSAYLKLCSDQKHSFLFESVEGGENIGRYSIIGYDPDFIWAHKNNATTLTTNDTTQTDTRAPLISLKEHIAANKIDYTPPNANLPPMAVSGLFGYLGYDSIRWIENIPNDNLDDLKIPDSTLIRPKTLVIFDNVKDMICIVRAVYNHVDNSEITANDALLANKNNVDKTINALKKAIPQTALNATSTLTAPLDITSNMSPDAYKDAVKQAQEYILDGDIFQVVLSQRFETPFDLPSIDLYRSLRRLNPSPFLFHVKLDDIALVGSSPEVLVRCRDNTVTIRPIAGTRPRGADRDQDLQFEKDLLADEKERAEHLMLLDLGRNDVGAVSEYGSVKITDSYMIERYSHVMHIVSNVEGTLRQGKDSVDAFFSGFPAGTVSGAPKIRAMEIIDELEISQRKSYAGAIGYFSGNGDIDSCIALRTGLIKDNKLYVQAGAGIVADSVPQSEHEECINKAKAVLNAAETAIESSKQR